MGKLIDNEKVLTIVSSAIVSVLVVFIVFVLNAGFGYTSELKKDIDKKVDKTEFYEHKADADARMNRIESEQRVIMLEIRNLLKDLSSETAEVKTEIAWIKKELNKKSYEAKR